MKTWPGAQVRDWLAAETRFMICDKWGFAPFEHQASWWAASDGLALAGRREKCSTLYESWRGEGNKPDWDPTLGYPARLKFGDGGQWWLLQNEKKELYYQGVNPRRKGRARVLALLGSFKIGKSQSTGLWTASFGLVDGYSMEFVGMEYDTSEPEFVYVKEFLFSERGLSLPYERIRENSKHGDMELVVEQSGARFRVQSWRTSKGESLEGKERDGYVFTEAYRLPGFMVYDGLSQNLQARDGAAVFPTTRKRPWVEVLHDAGHSEDPDFDHFHCTCGVERDKNPHTFDERAMRAAEKTMTRETFGVHWLGRAGTWLGSVYEYTRGDREVRPPHPLFPGKERGDPVALTEIVIPSGWARWCGIDLGSFHGACFVVLDPDGNAYAIHEVTNYHYVSSEIDLKPEVSYEKWVREVLDSAALLGGRWRYFGDANLQMKRDLRNTYGLVVETGVPDRELRCDITREFFQHDKFWVAPWLEILPVELEKAKFPPETSSTGYYRRIKKDDHTLDGVEHVCGRRGKGKHAKADAPASPIRELVGNARLKHPLSQWDPHLGG